MAQIQNAPFARRLVATSVSIALAVGSLQGCSPANFKLDSLLGDSGSDLSASRDWSAIQVADPCSESVKMQQQIGNAIVGAAAGAVAGAILGALLDSLTKDKKHTAAQAGAIAGAGLGIYIAYNKAGDSVRRQCEMAKAAEANQTKAAFVSLRGSSGGESKNGEVTITPDQGHFLQGSDQLTDAGKSYYKALAEQYTSAGQKASFENTVKDVARRDGRAATQANYAMSERQKSEYEGQWSRFRIVLTGHTDDVGDPAKLLALSEGRAKAVAQIFHDAGIPDSQLLYQGAGAAFPISDNHTAEGRAKNGRVEVVVLYSADEIQHYVDARQTKYEYFQPIPSTNSMDQVLSAPSHGLRETLGTRSVERVTTTKSQPKTIAPMNSPHAGNLNVARDARNLPKAAGTGVGLPINEAEDGIDFGGKPIASSPVDLVSKIGTLKPQSDGFSIASLLGIGPATAAPSTPISSCLYDNPKRYAPGAIKRFSDGMETARRNEYYYLDLKNLGISGRAGDHQIELRGVSALASGELVRSPTFRVYKSYFSKNPTERSKSKPDLTIRGPAIAFRGEKGLLLRQFLNGEEGLQCIDIVFPSNPAKSGFKMDDVALIYKFQRSIRVARPEMM